MIINMVEYARVLLMIDDSALIDEPEIHDTDAQYELMEIEQDRRDDEARDEKCRGK